MLVGFTVNVPVTGTGVPFRSPLTAFFDVHVKVEEFPAVIDVALALIPAATVPEDELDEEVVTLTVTAFDTVAPVLDVAIKV